jgi:hypothetical protein
MERPVILSHEMMKGMFDGLYGTTCTIILSHETILPRTSRVNNDVLVLTDCLNSQTAGQLENQTQNYLFIYRFATVHDLIISLLLCCNVPSLGHEHEYEHEYSLGPRR